MLYYYQVPPFSDWQFLDSTESTSNRNHWSRRFRSFQIQIEVSNTARSISVIDVNIFSSLDETFLRKLIRFRHIIDIILNIYIYSVLKSERVKLLRSRRSWPGTSTSTTSSWTTWTRTSSPRTGPGSGGTSSHSRWISWISWEGIKDQNKETKILFIRIYCEQSRILG